MFIPYRVDVPFDRRPVMNWIISAAVVVVFVSYIVAIAQQLEADTFGDAPRPMIQYVLTGWSIKGLFGYMWLHAGLWHLIGNLIFLWLFGNAVCAKLGNRLYLPVYIGLGVFAGICHLLFAGGDVVGASGAINGLVGMYLVFFPENSISCFFLLLWYPVRFSISGYWMILLWFVFDIFGLLRGTGGVAYVAHVGGFLAGFTLAIIMLKTRLIRMERDEKSLLALVGLDKTSRVTTHRGDIAYWQQDLEDKGAESKAITEELPETIPFDSEQPADPFIRFECECGQRVKVPVTHAGKMGRCPKCQKKVKIPSD